MNKRSVKTIGERLQEHMHAHGMTQTDLALQSGLSQALISRLVAGTSGRPRRRTLETLEAVLGTSVEDLQRIPVSYRPLHRSARIVRYWLRRQAKDMRRQSRSATKGDRGRDRSHELAVELFSQRTSIPEHRVWSIEAGSVRPSALEIDLICKGINCTIYFMLGIRRESFDNKTLMYCKYVTGDPNPPQETLQKFRALYRDLLLEIPERSEQERDRA